VAGFTQAGTTEGDGLALIDGEALEIIADDVRNALVILATPEQYRMVESAVRKLDVVPLQVLIEARILEVALRDDLSYGVEWFFQNNDINSGEGRSRGTLDSGSTGIAGLVPGFAYTILDTADRVRFALNLLASESDVNVLSSPSLMVLDNQTATINVGDEIPVPARQSTSNIDPNSPTVNEISFRQTGITLSVTPRVSSSGLVTMEISQEVATAATTTTSNIDAPTIQNRAIDSVVAVNSGETIVLGGLMQTQQSTSGSGIPGLRRIPGIGKLFGQTSNEDSRTELLVLITPRVVRNRDDVRSITEEFRQKLPQLQRFETEGAPKS
jgi:general secretion pathway protein D